MAERGSSRAGGVARWLLAWLAILGLVAVVAWLASERNSHRWSLVPDEGRLVVMKGMFLPAGRQELKPTDPVLARVYAPLAPPQGKPLPEERTYDEQAELDRALYDILSGWAREDVATGDPARLERGLGYISRALDLPGLSASQREDLAALRAESGYHEARRLLEKARAELAEAVEKLKLTTASRSARAADASALLRDLGPALEAATAAARAAQAAAPRPDAPPDAAAQDGGAAQAH
jgi:hypothetical protein